MFDEPDENQVDSSDDAEFQAAFTELTAGDKPPEQPAAPENKAGEPEGAVPEEKVEEQTPPPATEAETPSQTAAAEQAPEVQADPLANASPEVKALVEQLTRERDDASYRARSDANRVSALTRKLVSLTEAPKPKAEEKKDDKPSQLDELLGKLDADFPDIGKALKTIIETQKSEIGTLRQTVEAVGTAQEVETIAAQMTVLQSRHPDFQQLAQDKDFLGWASAQPPAVQHMVTSWDAREVSIALDLFKAERGAAMHGQQPPPKEEAKAPAATDEKRNQQLEGGRDVGSKPAPAASGPPDEYEAAFAHFAAKRQEMHRAR